MSTTFFRCPPVNLPKFQHEECHAVKMPCVRCSKNTWVCANQQLAINKNPKIEILCYFCADAVKKAKPLQKNAPTY